MNYQTSSDKFRQQAQTRSDRTACTREEEKRAQYHLNFEPVNKLY